MLQFVIQRASFSCSVCNWITATPSSEVASRSRTLTRLRLAVVVNLSQQTCDKN
ncbi:hypothetical protein LINPERPRIM_LOCUS19863 [Linum perenne]